jgi:hypothetical protein
MVYRMRAEWTWPARGYDPAIFAAFSYPLEKLAAGPTWIAGFIQLADGIRVRQNAETAATTDDNDDGIMQAFLQALHCRAGLRFICA